jgi:predicted MFS family arabinose efflux permease
VSDAIIEPSRPTIAVDRHVLLRTISTSIFVIFFQTYMVAPLIPTLAISLHASQEQVSLLIPAYTFAALLCGALSDHWGRRGIFFFSLAAFPIVSVAMAAAPNLNWLIALRILSGAANVGTVVVGLSLVGDLFPPEDRGRAVGWIFGAIAGGGAFGSTVGGLLAPSITWRGLFILTAIPGTILLLRARPLWRQLVGNSPTTQHSAIAHFLFGYGVLLRTWRAVRTYAFIFLNAIFHAGVFTWLGVLLHDRYHLGDVGIGLALLGYGVPGLLLGPTIGKIVDRRGRRYIIPAGFFVAAISAALLAPSAPLIVAAIAITILSFGFDMTHPLLAGIATTLDNQRRGQAMGFNAFSIFSGFGCGSLIFGYLAHHSMADALIIFACMQGFLGLIAIFIFRTE